MTVRSLSYEADYDVVPQAILWRPLNYFTASVGEGEDGLDQFHGASFAIGNEIKFDLRVYRGHPELTVTLYLPDEGLDDKRVNEIINIVIKEMLIPLSAVAWRRGQPFQYGQLERAKDDRLREPEARILVLKIAARQPGRTASTRFLKKEVPNYIALSPMDRTRSKSRPSEEIWQQIVGNVHSHKRLFKDGLALETTNGLTVTEKGLDYLNNMGFSASVRSSVE